MVYYNKIIVVIFCLIFITSCQTPNQAIDTKIPEEYQADAEEQVEQRKKEIEKSAVEIPDWFLEPELSGEFITSVATSTSTDLQMSYDKAILLAKRSLADKVQSYISAKLKSVRKEESTGEDSDNYAQVEESIINLITNQNLAGYSVNNKKILSLDTKYRSYVQLIYPTGKANKFILEGIKKDDILRKRLESSEALKDLENEIEKAKNQ